LPVCAAGGFRRAVAAVSRANAGILRAGTLSARAALTAGIRGATLLTFFVFCPIFEATMAAEQGAKNKIGKLLEYCAALRYNVNKLFLGGSYEKDQNYDDDAAVSGGFAFFCRLQSVC
jgi:hypothetical protein